MQYVKLKKIVDLKQGLAINSKSNHLVVNYETKLPLLRIADMQTNRKVVFMDEKTPEKFWASENDIIYTRTGKVGLVFRKQKGVVHNNCFRVIPKNDKELDRNYLFWVLNLKSIYDYANTIAAGVAQPDLPHDSFKTIKIPLFDVNYQHKIVELLDSYDNLIEINNRRIKILEQMAENLYKEWFVRFRFPGHENVEFVDGVPKGWTFKRIEKIGKVVAGGTPSTNVNEYWNGSVPWLTPADLSNYDGIYIKNGSTNISELGLKKSSAVLLPANTVLLSSRAPIGYVALAKQPITTNQGFKSVVCNEKIVNCYYLFYFFKMNRSLLESFGSGATFLELSAKGLSRVKILVPSINIQKEFGSIIKKVAEKIDNFQLQNQNLIKQRDYLLPRLMSGKLQVK